MFLLLNGARPKSALRAELFILQLNQWCYAEPSVLELPINPDPTWIISVPLRHSYGFASNLLAREGNEAGIIFVPFLGILGYPATSHSTCVINNKGSVEISEGNDFE